MQPSDSGYDLSSLPLQEDGQSCPSLSGTSDLELDFFSQISFPVYPTGLETDRSISEAGLRGSPITISQTPVTNFELNDQLIAASSKDGMVGFDHPHVMTLIYGNL